MKYTGTLITIKDMAARYYFSHQRIWEFFPENSREKIRAKLIASATKYRKKHPDKNLRVPFWPKSGLAAYQGMNSYDPHFGEEFYTNSFHAGITHEDLLRGIRCKTLFLKAKTVVGEDGLLMAALSEDDLRRVLALVPNCSLIRFDCGHAIHIEKQKEFISAILSMVI
jgi:pimeloyl-ACP methyl ester carboxylesterase